MYVCVCIINYYYILKTHSMYAEQKHTVYVRKHHCIIIYVRRGRHVISRTCILRRVQMISSKVIIITKHNTQIISCWSCFFSVHRCRCFEFTMAVNVYHRVSSCNYQRSRSGSLTQAGFYKQKNTFHETLDKFVSQIGSQEVNGQIIK